MNDSERPLRRQGAVGTRRTGGTDPSESLTAEVRLRFVIAEDRIYPLAMADPAAYEAAVSLVGLVANELTERCTDVKSVLQCRDELIATLPELATANGLDPSGISADIVVDAASALRCRDLQFLP